MGEEEKQAAYFCPVVARDLAEGFVAVDDGVVDDLSICQEETAVSCTQSHQPIKKEDEEGGRKGIH